MYFQPPENVNGEAELMICQEDSPEVKREKRESKECFKSLDVDDIFRILVKSWPKKVFSSDRFFDIIQHIN